MVATGVLGMMMTPQLPYHVPRCKGVRYIEDDETYWREGCEQCLRRTSPPNPNPEQQWVEPPTIITFFCEYLLEESDVQSQPASFPRNSADHDRSCH
jgi:hypothetical protein